MMIIYAVEMEMRADNIDEWNEFDDLLTFHAKMLANWPCADSMRCK